MKDGKSTSRRLAIVGMRLLERVAVKCCAAAENGKTKLRFWDQTPVRPVL